MCYLLHPYYTWNFMMIHLEQIGASLLPRNEDTRLISVYYLQKKSKLYDQGRLISQTDRQTKD